MGNWNTNSGHSIVMRSLRRLPLLRAYPALQDAREQLRESRQKIQSLAADLERANQRANQRAARQELALRAAGTGHLLLAAPVFDDQRLAQVSRERAST